MTEITVGNTGELVVDHIIVSHDTLKLCKLIMVHEPNLVQRIKFIRIAAKLDLCEAKRLQDFLRDVMENRTVQYTASGEAKLLAQRQFL